MQHRSLSKRGVEKFEHFKHLNRTVQYFQKGVEIGQVCLGVSQLIFEIFGAAIEEAGGIPGSKIASTFFEHFVLSLSMSTDCKNATATLFFEQVIKAKHPLGPNGKIIK